MKVLIYEPNGALQKFLTDYMLHNRLTPQIIDREANIFQTLTSRDFDIFLTDYSTKEEIINDIIFNIKLDARLDFIKIFITTPRPEIDVLQTLIQLGVNGFIKKPFVEKQFSHAFGTWLSRNSFRNNKRAHTRVRPMPADNAFIYLRIDQYNRDIPCEIIDISAGGIAAELPRSFERLMYTYFSVGQSFTKVRLKIRRVAIRINIEIVTIIQRRLSFKFTNSKDEALKYIYHYIADNLES